MKLQKIVVALLSLLLAGAAIMSIVAIGDIGKNISDDGKTDGTSSGTSSGSTDNTEEPGGSDTSVNYLEGNVVKTASDYIGTSTGYYKLNTGRAFVCEFNGIIYCGVKFDIPTAMNDLFVSYQDIVFDYNFSTVFRYSYDKSKWYLLDEDIYSYSGDHKYAEINKNNSGIVYMSFYTLSATEYTLDSALEHFESFASESLNVYISNLSSGGASQ